MCGRMFGRSTKVLESKYYFPQNHTGMIERLVSFKERVREGGIDQSITSMLPS